MTADYFDLGGIVRRSPNALAVVTAQGEYWSYERLGQEVCGAMSRLVVEGVSEGSFVAIRPKRDLESLVRLHAIFELGAAAVLIHPSWTGSEERRALEQLPSSLCDIGEWTWERSENSLPMRDTYSPDLPLSVAFTSGTTGQSRGALATRGAWSHACEASAANLGWQQEDCWLLTMPPAHVGGLGIVLRCMAAGATVALHDAEWASAVDVAAFMEEAQVTLASMVPTMLFRALRDAPEWTGGTSLRALLLGGAACSEEILQEAVGRGLPIRTTYGLSESCGQVTTEGPIRGVGALGSAGNALPGWDVEIRDGSIWIRGRALFDGYWVNGKRVEPELDTRGFWRTGDAGMLDAEDRLWVHGRDEDLIISGGENVYPAEIEGALARVPGVIEVAVVGVIDPEWGQRVTAYVVLDSELGSVQALEIWAQEHLAPFRRPRTWIPVASIPKTRSGKMRRSLLVQRDTD